MHATSVSGKNDLTYAELETNMAFPDTFLFPYKTYSNVCTTHVLLHDTAYT